MLRMFVKFYNAKDAKKAQRFESLRNIDYILLKLN